MRFLYLSFFIIAYFSAYTQSSKSFFTTIDTLCSPSFHGRGADFDGQGLAADYLSQRFASLGLQYFGKDYNQVFEYDVNTFSGDLQLSINNKPLQAAIDFIPYASSNSGKGQAKKVHYFPNDTSKIHSSKKKIALVVDGKDLKTVSESLKKKTDLILVKKKGSLVMPVGRYQSPFTSFFVSDSILPQKIKRIDYSVESKLLQGYKARNIVGYIEGTKNPDSLIVLSAHYDHVGHIGKDAYTPGANDNASGTALVLELANYYQKHLPEKTIVFVLFGGEEAGLVGSKYLSEHVLFPLENVNVMYNLDLMGSGSEGITVVNALKNQRVIAKMNNVNENQKYFYSIKERKQAANSDHYYFAENGVPAVFIYARGKVGGYHDIYDTPEKLEKDSFTVLFDFFTELLSK